VIKELREAHAEEIDKLKMRVYALEEELLKTKEQQANSEHTGEGWLLKGAKIAFGKWSWKRRYFRCDRNRMTFEYYEEPTSSKPIKKITLPTFFEITDQPSKYIAKKNAKASTVDKVHSFAIVTTKRVWYFVAASEGEKKAWISYWKQALFSNFKEGYREGWLKKRTSNKLMEIWHLRYFRFDLKAKTMLSYYSDCDPHPLKDLSLDAYTFVKVAGSTENQFELCSAHGRKFQFEALTTKDYADWEKFFSKLNY